MRSVDTVLERQLYSMEFSSGHCNGLMENRDVLSDRVLRQFIIVLEATILCITIFVDLESRYCHVITKRYYSHNRRLRSKTLVNHPLDSGGR